MTLITSLKGYIKRHRQGLLITATIAGGGYLAGKYASNKLRDIQEKSTNERLAKENLKRRFQQNQNDCVFTVLSLLPTLGDQVLSEMNIERDWAKLQESRKLEKIELKLKQEREQAAIFKEEQEAMNQLNDSVMTADSVVLVENNQVQDEGKSNEQATEQNTKDSIENGQQGVLDSSVGSLASSTTIENEADQQPLTPGILNKKDKHLIWEDIKTKSFIRSLTSIYSVTLLTLLTHIQLNLLGRFTYIWSVSVLNKSEPTIRLQQEGEEPDVGFLDPQIERMFLSASWWLLHRGWKVCAKRIEEAVNDVISSIPLKSTLNYREAEELMNKLRKRIEYDEDDKPISYRSWMLPDTEEEELECIRGAGFNEEYPKEDASTISLRKLLDETKDFIDGPDFHRVLNSCLNEVFAIFDHHAFATPLLPQNESYMISSSIREISPAEALQLEKEQGNSKKMTLANLLPTIGRQSHLVIAGNEYLNAFAYIKELQAFSALIYTHYGNEANIA
ncbi:MAG: Peroxin-3 [Benjaminiella poitrasii]|nr:MAG: Peroxin-3 [Benjaminiella poitrasii]